VLGRLPAAARVHPCLEWTGDIPALLDELGRRDIVQVMIECGSAVVRSFHDATGRRC
jgi:diaminohydroxyphosphoribosylaminopyrimidine deaminase/5-amino-6-(5-phosphoribosylamino)uracil reductase